MFAVAASTIVEISSAETCSTGAGADFATALSTILCNRASSIAGAGAAGDEQPIAAMAIIAIITVTDNNLPLLNRIDPPYYGNVSLKCILSVLQMRFAAP